jgi:hypothetical protein
MDDPEETTRWEAKTVHLVASVIYLVSMLATAIATIFLLWPEGLHPEAVLHNDCFLTCQVEARMLAIALAGGVLGAVVTALMTLTFFHSSGGVKGRWILEYVAHPLIGAVVGLVVYAALRGGLLKAAAQVDALNPYAVVALTTVAGFGTKQILGRVRDWLARMEKKTTGEDGPDG